MEAASRLDFGALLRQFRLDAGMTQQTLAERAKLSVEAVSTLERGARTRPYRETVTLLARALELSPEREALLERAVDVAQPPRRRRSVDLKPSLLRVVHSDAGRTRRHNLPQQLTSFVGRQREVAEIAALLREHRLVTVVGAGGVGKTRVAVQAGTELCDDYPDGVWLIDLAPLADPKLVASAVLAALQLPSTTGLPLDVLVASLQRRHVLLILDNCEHVIAATRDLASAIVASCASVRVVATSQEPLNVPGEQIYRLPSLAIPPDSSVTAQDALRYGAVALFVDRARAVDGSFAFTNDNAADIREICRSLDGIPLAIELAAARVKVLAPRQIAERLDCRFRLLTGGDPRAWPRHRTMVALLDWSYDLLTAREQRFFESLSVFAGDCTLEAVTAVCAFDGEDDIAVIDLVSSLVTKSLLVAELAGAEQRYRLLESSRQYAREKLLARGVLEDLGRRHASFYLEMAEGLDRAWDTTPDREWLAKARVELGNWRAALEWALGRGHDVVLGQRLCALRHVLLRSFQLPEARRWLEAAVAAVDELTPLPLVARLEYAVADGAAQFAEREASLAGAKRAVARYRELGDDLGIAQAETLAAVSLAVFGRPAEAEPLLQEALRIAQTLGDRRLLATILQTLGMARSLSGDLDGARPYLTDALGLAKALRADEAAASIASSLGSNELDAGNPEESLRLNRDALATYRALNSPALLPKIVGALGSISVDLLTLGRYGEAQANATEGLELARGLQMAVFVALSLLYLVVVALLTSPVGRKRTSAEVADAARLLGFVDARLIALGVPEPYWLPQEHDRMLTILRDAIPQDELTYLMTSGATMTEDEAIAQGRALA